MEWWQYSSTPILHHFNSAEIWLDDGTGRFMLPAFQLANRDSARLLLWVRSQGCFRRAEASSILKFSCSTDFSGGSRAISGLISAQPTRSFTSRIRESFSASRQSSRCKPAPIRCLQWATRPKGCSAAPPLTSSQSDR